MIEIDLVRQSYRHDARIAALIDAVETLRGIEDALRVYGDEGRRVDHFARTLLRTHAQTALAPFEFGRPLR